MGFRFRKSIKAGPFRINISKSGIGWSIGGKGYRYTKKANGGSRYTLSLPGTGLSYVTETSGKKKKATQQKIKAPDYRSANTDCTDISSNNISNSSMNTGCSNKHGCLWWLFIGWWAWIVEYAVWLLAKPIYIAYRYIKYLFTRTETDKFDFDEAACSEKISELTSKTVYKSQFYKTNGFFAFLCIFFPAISILTLLLNKDARNSKKKIVMVCICSAWWFILSLATCGGNSADIDAANEGNGIVSSSDEYFTLSDSDNLITSSSDAVMRQTTTTTTTTTTATTTQPTTTTTTEYVEMVWIPHSGNRYHRRASCSNMENPSQVTKEKAESMGYTPCGRCY